MSKINLQRIIDATQFSIECDSLICGVEPRTVQAMARSILELREALEDVVTLMSGAPASAPWTDDIVLQRSREALRAHELVFTE